jgi:hypothetical protein
MRLTLLRPYVANLGIREYGTHKLLLTLVRRLIRIPASVVFRLAIAGFIVAKDIVAIGRATHGKHCGNCQCGADCMNCRFHLAPHDLVIALSEYNDKNKDIKIISKGYAALPE